MQSGGSVSPNPRMESHMMRLATFRNLPESSSLSPAVVSKAGFYYIGVGDTVACYSCGLRLNHMESGVHPTTVHQQFSPECQLVLIQQQSIVSAENTNAASSRGRQHHNAAGRQAHTHGPNRLRDSPTVDSSHRNTDRFPSRRMRERINNNDPTLLEEMKYKRHRLSSYGNWPRDTNIAPEALAEDGLFYLCRADRVKCAFCRGILRNWEPSDDPMRKHRHLFPECPFLNNPRAAGNVVLGNEPSEEQSLDVNPPNSLSGDIQGSRPKHPNKDCIKDRRATFQSWPPDSHTSPDKLAAAGFFYKDSTDDRYTCCFFCGGCIYDWQLDDDPMTKHHRHFPRCGFVKAIKQEHRQRPICPS